MPLLKFHIGCFGNYELWEQNPIKTIPIAHGISDPHFGFSNIRNKIAYNGIYNWLYTLGFNRAGPTGTCSGILLYNFVITHELLAVISIPLALIHLIYLDSLLQATPVNGHMHKVKSVWPFKFFCAYFDVRKQRLNFHTGILIGFLSIAWCAHLVHLAIPISRGSHGWHYSLNSKLIDPFYMAGPAGTCMFFSGHLEKDNHIFRSTYGAGESSFTFAGGLKSNTISLYLTDIAHHHLGVGILFVLSTHLYLSLYKGFGHRIGDLFFVNNVASSTIPLNKSLHLQLSLGCTGLGTITSVVGQQVYSLRPYVYLCYDYITTLALYLHHQYIASFFVMATLAHGGILLRRDYTFICMAGPTSWTSFTSCRILKMKGQFISHLSWICLYLGFHTFGVYIHNDSIVAFHEQEKQILIEAVFAFSYQCIFSATMPLGPGDLFAHHAIALGLHVTILILFKGSLHARGSKLMPDKINFAVSFACDGPIRGGTCDISAWDSNYLALFWMLNTGAWITFYFHWKHLSVWLNTVFQFDESSTYLNGWFRDYLWFNSRPLMNGYNTFGANDLSILSWAFLGAHLSWATGFMFLISWRGYWSEFIDIILVMHLKTPILYTLWNGDIFIKNERYVGPYL